MPEFEAVTHIAEAIEPNFLDTHVAVFVSGGSEGEFGEAYPDPGNRVNGIAEQGRPGLAVMLKGQGDLHADDSAGALQQLQVAPTGGPECRIAERVQNPAEAIERIGRHLIGDAARQDILRRIEQQQMLG